MAWNGGAWLVFLRTTVEKGTQVQTAARVVRTPPSRILSLPSHTAVNTGCFAIGVLCLAGCRILFSESGGIGLLPTTMMTVFSFVFLIGCGFLVNLIFADGKPIAVDDVPTTAADLANKWVTYNIVGFILTIAIYTAISLLVWVLAGESAVNWLTDIAAEHRLPGSDGAYNLTFISVCAMFAFLIIYAKTKRSFVIDASEQPEILIAFLIGIVVVALTVFVFGFKDF